FIVSPLKQRGTTPPSHTTGGNLNHHQVTPLHYSSVLQDVSAAAQHAPASTGASPHELSVLLTSPRRNQDVGAAGWYLRGSHCHCHHALCLHHFQSSLKTVQAFMILSIIFSVIALVMFIAQLFTLEKGKRFYITGTIMLVCWLCILIAVSIYTARFQGQIAPSVTSHHGYCFILAWICFCFSFIIGILYLVLRKK
uniref:Epithelial membrane protein 1 n=1 Tax=Melopsittacus undulatus TaxID=13146 RepID=A0A8V5GGG8_MELUD